MRAGREPSHRAVGAAAVLLLGIAFCFLMYWWQLRYQYAFHDVTGNLYLAIPFAGLAAMVAGGMSRIPAAVGWLILAFLTGAAYIGNATTDSSTASIVFIVPFIYGALALSIIFAIDHILRHRRRPR